MNTITEGVGKKIVDALKQQSDIEIQNVIDSPVGNGTEPVASTVAGDENNTLKQHFTSNVMSLASQEKEESADELDNFEIPTNVSVLKQLISQLPAGVSKQTGAQIIKQTMEALGISMKSVLQEAQSVQENLTNSTKECQASIMEYRKQIGFLERQEMLVETLPAPRRPCLGLGV